MERILLLTLITGLFTLSANPQPAPDRLGRPNLKFACELASAPLESLFSDSRVIADLSALHAGVALRTSDLSLERARVVRQLNQANIPVTAWLGLPKEEGYFLNADNSANAVARFAGFETWSEHNHLRWDALGLDIEPNFLELQNLSRSGIWHLVPLLTRRSFDYDRLRRAKQSYASLVKQIRERGYSVETYQFFFLADERKARSHLLERLSGVIDVPADRECLMLYTSFHHSWGSSIIQSYGRDAKCIIVGSTGGDSALDAGFAPLNWDELARDLRTARYWTPNIGIYSLEGCVRQGFLPRLKALDWNLPVASRSVSGIVLKVRLLRHAIAAVLWISTHLYLVAASLIAATGLLWWIVFGTRRSWRRVTRRPLA